jgi:hypothetical protein
MPGYRGYRRVLGDSDKHQEQSVPVVVDGERAQTTKQTVSFSVDEAFRGVEGSFATVTSGGDLCGFPFYKQKRYLIYAGRQKDGTLHVSICGGTKLLADAANDLVYLRTIATRAPSGFIFGTVFKYADPANSNARVPVVRLMRAVTGQQVRIRGRQSYTVVVNEKGQFRLDGVEAGRYEISIDIQDSAGSNPSKIVDVAAKGCWWPGTESNRRRQPFQGCALPAELPGPEKYRKAATSTKPPGTRSRATVSA